MTYVVVYDVSDEAVRNRLSKSLEGYGERVQESVFECRLDSAALEELKRVVIETLGAECAGNVRIYRVCADCMRSSIGIGDIRRSAGGDGFLVV